MKEEILKELKRLKKENKEQFFRAKCVECGKKEDQTMVGWNSALYAVKSIVEKM